MRGVWTMRIAWLVGILLGMTAEAARSDEYYFGLIFGSQSSPKRLRDTHTWLTVVKAVGEGPDLNTYALEAHTISWLPRTLKVKVFRPWAEPGVNLDLDQTLAFVYQNGENVRLWGPFVVTKEIYDRALQVERILHSGAARYRAISTQYNLLVGDCIHAVAAIDPEFGRGHYPLVRVGHPASRYMAHEMMMRSPFDQTLYENSWLIGRLGLDRYPIIVVPPQRIPKRGCGLCRHPD